MATISPPRLDITSAFWIVLYVLLLIVLSAVALYFGWRPTGGSRWLPHRQRHPHSRWCWPSGCSPSPCCSCCWWRLPRILGDGDKRPAPSWRRLALGPRV